jgi:hypothetical protein
MDIDLQYVPTTTAKGTVKIPKGQLSHEIHKVVDEVADEGAGGLISDRYYSILERKRREVDYFLQAFLLRLDRETQSEADVERLHVKADERLRTIQRFLQKYTA